MTIALIAFSTAGAELAGYIASNLTQNDYEVRSFIAARHAEGLAGEPFSSIYDLIAIIFSQVDVLIFIGACGIAVRAIAPQIRSKLTDPAVLVCDETGQFVISLLSGHAGGANEWTMHIASILGAAPVITTASDVHTTLSGLPQPQNLYLGIGCRRGLTTEIIERAVTIMLWDQRIPLKRIKACATIDIKKDEFGLCAFAQAHNIPLHYYTASALAAIPGNFTVSEFVMKTVGVDNVCERAATMLGGYDQGRLLIPKTIKDGVTIAVFERW